MSFASGTRRRGGSWYVTTTPPGRRRAGEARSEGGPPRLAGARTELARHGSNHTPDNSYVHFPDHDTLMLVDIVNCGWAPVYMSNLTEDIPGYVAPPAHA